MTDMIIPQSPITAQSNPIVPPAPAFKKKTKWGKILVGLVALVVVVGGGVWGYYKLNSSKLLVANIVTGCDPANPTGGTSLQTCVPDGVGGAGGNTGTGYHWTTCKDGYHGVNGEGCIENAHVEKPNMCADNPGTQTSCVQGGTQYSGCLCCPPNTTAQYTDIFTATNESFEADACGFGNVRLGSTAVGSRTVCVPDEGPGNHCTEQKFTLWQHSCQRVSCVGAASPSPSPSASPTMACTSITSTPAVSPAPVVGTKMTFTCLGTVTPATAGTVSYKFQYSINNAAPLTLSPLTATPNKTELTINACGTYKVQCKACATLNGVLTCAPEWAAVK